jgi:hypothetical protein
MAVAHSSVRNLRVTIIGQTKLFLIGLEICASDEVLTSILLDIKDKELRLIKEEGVMLSPELWKFLQYRFAKRKFKDIIDTTDYSNLSTERGLPRGAR